MVNLLDKFEDGVPDCSDNSDEQSNLCGEETFRNIHKNSLLALFKISLCHMKFLISIENITSDVDPQKPEADPDPT